MKWTNISKSAGRKFAVSLCLSIAALSLASPAFGRADDEEDKTYDARLLGYEKNVQLDSGSTASSWIVFVLLAGLLVMVLLKDAKRSHLD